MEVQPAKSAARDQALLIPNDDIFQTSLDSEDYLEILAPIIKESLKGNNLNDLVDKLEDIVLKKDEELEELSKNSTNDIISCIDTIDLIDSNSDKIKTEILSISSNLDQTGTELATRKNNAVQIKTVSNKINDTTSTLNSCLQVLELTNIVHDMIKERKYFNALKNIDDLNNIHLQDIQEFSFSKKIFDSIPTLRKVIKDDSFENVTKWLSILEKKLFQIGDSLFINIELINSNWQQYVESSPDLAMFRVNSPVELALRDPSLNFNLFADSSLQISLETIYDCILVYQTIDEEETLRNMYQKEWLKKRDRIIYPVSNNTTNNEKIDFNFTSLDDYLKKICGFFVADRLINNSTQFRLRTDLNSNDLWDSLESKLVPVLLKFVNTLRDVEELFQAKNVIGKFVQIMQCYNYKVDGLYEVLILIFKRYSSDLTDQFAVEFSTAIIEDESTPIVLRDSREYEKLISTCWYKPTEQELARSFPKSVPFSSSYLDFCFQIRDFISKNIQFVNEYFGSELNKIFNILVENVDYTLSKIVCVKLFSFIDTNNREQTSQTLINLEYFVIAAKELGKLLSGLQIGGTIRKINLTTVDVFIKARKTAEDNLFNMVDYRIKSLMEIADYDWASNSSTKEPNYFVVDIGQYLDTMFMSTFAKLPQSVRTLLLFRAFDLLASIFLQNLKASPKVTMAALETFNMDMVYIEEVIKDLNSKKELANANANGNSRSSTDFEKSVSLQSTFLELRESINLMLHGSLDEYRDQNIRMRKYERVKPEDAYNLISKLQQNEEIETETMRTNSPSPSIKNTRFGKFAYSFATKNS